MFVFIFLLGLALGSFANVLIYRIPRNISIILPFSFCPQCNSPIKWYDNIPLVSYFLLSGKCRSCGTKISVSYPVVELLCGVISVVLYFKFGISLMWIFLNLFFVLLVISVIDIKTTLIPDVLSYYLIISGVVLSVFNPLLAKDVLVGDVVFIRICNSLIGGIVGFLLFYLISFFGSKIFKKPVLGGGDIKLFCGVGTYLGLHSLLKITFYSSVLAVVYVLVVSIIKQEKLFGKYIQFAPFISLGSLLTLFF